MSVEKWLASTTEEYWDTPVKYDSKEEAIKEGPNNLDLEEDDPYFFVGKIKKITAKDIVSRCISRFIETLQEEAYDRVDEYAEGWLSEIGKEKQQQLVEIVSKFIDENDPPSFFVVVDIEEVKLKKKEEDTP